MQQVDGFPRRNRIDLLTPVEKEIYDLVQKVEDLGADVLLTDVVVKLGEAREALADWVEKDAETPR